MILPNNTDEQLPAPLQRVTTQRWQQGRSQTVEDWVAVEVPVALIYNGISHAVMMVTPADLADFALGFSMTEGIISKPEELYDVHIHALEQGIELQMEISSRRQSLLKQHRRNLAGQTGCGLCGVESLQQIVGTQPRVKNKQPINAVAIQNALQQLPHWQPFHKATGAFHGAAWCNRDGDILMAREDVGRHNALDKLIGALYRAQKIHDQGFVTISSRASFEMVKKVACVGIGNLVAVSAPTSLALQTAHQSGVNLIGFGRPDRHMTYNV